MKRRRSSGFSVASLLAIVAALLLVGAVFAQELAKRYVYVGGRLVAVEVPVNVNVSITVDPVPTLYAGQPFQLQASVSGATNTDVTWDIVSGAGNLAGGNSGNTSNPVTFNAPTGISSQDVTVVRVTSVEDPAISPTISIFTDPVTVMISAPPAQDMVANQVHDFSVTVEPNPPGHSTESWSVVPPGIGTIAQATGVFTVPASVGTTQATTIRVEVDGDSTRVATRLVSLSTAGDPPPPPDPPGGGGPGPQLTIDWNPAAQPTTFHAVGADLGPFANTVQSSAAAEGFVEYYLSADAFLVIGSDPLLNSKQFTLASAGSQDVNPPSVVVPVTTPLGPRYLIAFGTDGSDSPTNPDCIGTGNVVCFPIEIISGTPTPGPDPDYVPQVVPIRSVFTTMESPKVQVWVGNIGAPATTPDIGIFGALLKQSGQTIEEKFTQALPLPLAGSSPAIGAEFNTFSMISAGSYEWLGEIRAAPPPISPFSDSNPNNNTSAPVSFVVANPGDPDLSCPNLVVAGGITTADLGESFNVTCTPENVGTAGAGGATFRIGFYLSDDDHISTSDLLLDSSSCVGLSVPASGDTGADCTATVTIPLNVAPGNRFIGVLVDDENTVAEEMEDNNDNAEPLFVNAPPSAISVDPSAGAGSLQTFVAKYFDANGEHDFQYTFLRFDDGSGGWPNQCILQYHQNLNEVSIVDDNGNWGAPVPLGTATTLSNSACSVDVSGVMVTAFDSVLTVSYPVTFGTPQSNETYSIDLWATDDSNSDSGWLQRGTWENPAASSGGGIFANGYTYRRTLTVPASQVSGSTDLTDFPLLVDGTFTYLKTLANGGNVESSSGYDIRFETDSGTKLDHEVDTWNGSTGEFVAWVRIPTLNATADTSIHMYYGKSSLSFSEENPTGVWPAATYEGVYHLSEDPGTGSVVIDSTGQDNGSFYGSMDSADAVAGEIGNALDFDGLDDRVSFGTGDHLTSWTLSCWVNAPNLPFQGASSTLVGRYENYHLIWNHPTTSFRGSAAYRIFPTWNPERFNEGGLTTSNWHHVVGSYDGTEIRAYLDGVLVDSNTLLPGVPASSSGGFGVTVGAGTQGKIDEARISSLVRSADWVVTEFNNQRAPGLFAATGLEETTSGGSGSGGSPTGLILREYWNGIGSNTVSSLTGHASYPDSPSGSEFLTSIQGPSNAGENYGARIRGFIHPTTTGVYTFWIASDDHSELWLSSDGDPVNISLIANVSAATSSQQWDKYPSQQSSLVSLLGGQKYYIEVLHKEGAVGDHVAVAWQGPGISQSVIGASYISQWGSGGGTNQSPTLTNPGAQTDTIGDSVNLQVVASDPEDTLTYSASSLPTGLTINSSSGVITGTVGGSAQSYSSTVTVDDGVNTPVNANFTWTVNASGGGHTTISLEAEDGTTVARAGQDWVLKTDFAGYSGTGFRRAEPNNGVLQNSNYVGQVTEIQFSVSFPTSGTYYIWVRSEGATASDNSIHVGLNGASTAGGEEIHLPVGGGWQWTGDSAMLLTIPSSGSHTVNVWMREDGTRLDTLVLTTDPNYTPGGNQSPSLTSPGAQTDTIGDSVNLQVVASDPEDTLTYSASSLPTGLTINSSSGVITGTVGGSAQTYNSSVTVNDGTNPDVTQNFTWTVNAPGFTTITLEAEDGVTIARGGKDWEYKTNISGYSGTGFRVAEPNTGINQQTNYVGNVTEIQFSVDFPSSGTYYLWVLANGQSGGDDSLHVGLNGAQTTGGNGIFLGHAGGWQWTGDSSRFLTIPSAGTHTVNVWMREDGTPFDKMILTDDSNYTASGSGPTYFGENTGLETGSTSPWFAFSGATQSVKSAAKRSGNWGLEVVTPSSGPGVYQDDIFVTNGKTYRVTAWVKIVSGGDKLKLWCHDPNYNNQHSHVLDGISSSSFQKLTLDYTANSTGEMWIQIFADEAATTYYVDDITIEELP